jgi:alpha/beta superfamily hydrolase
MVLDWPDGAVPAGLAYVAHPHPLYGGSLDNKVVTTLARAFCALDWLAVRFNFRGVGATEGSHDEGRGELDDLLHLIDRVPRLPEVAQACAAALPTALAGFSFGSFVAARAAAQLEGRGRPARHLVLAGAAAGKWPMPPVDPATLVVHGEQDDVIALADVLQWAGGCAVPVVVLPGGGHFFHRRLTLLKRLVIRHLLGAEAQSHLAGADDDSKTD